MLGENVLSQSSETTRILILVLWKETFIDGVSYVTFIIFY